MTTYIEKKQYMCNYYKWLIKQWQATKLYIKGLRNIDVPRLVTFRSALFSLWSRHPKSKSSFTRCITTFTLWLLRSRRVWKPLALMPQSIKAIKRLCYLGSKWNHWQESLAMICSPGDAFWRSLDQDARTTQARHSCDHDRTLLEADGYLFGFGTRFGTMPAQMKAFLDATGQHWAKGALAGKFAGTFFSTASQHGGQETTALITVTYFAHHGIIYVPFGFAHPHLFDNSEVVGGSAYGAGTVAQVLLPFSFRSCDCRRLMVAFFFLIVMETDPARFLKRNWKLQRPKARTLVVSFLLSSKERLPSYRACMFFCFSPFVRQMKKVYFAVRYHRSLFVCVIQHFPLQMLGIITREKRVNNGIVITQHPSFPSPATCAKVKGIAFSVNQANFNISHIWVSFHKRLVLFWPYMLHAFVIRLIVR